MRSIGKLLRDIHIYFSPQLKSQAIKVVLLIFITSIVDLLGVAFVIPILTLILSGKSESSPFLSQIKNLLEINSDNVLLIYLLLFFLIVLVGKVLFINFSHKIQGRYVYGIFDFLVKKRYRKIYFDGDKLENKKLNSDTIKSEIYLLPRVFSQQLLLSLFNFFAEGFILLLVFAILLLYQWEIVLVLLITLLPLMYLFFRRIKSRVETIDLELNKNLPKVSSMVSIVHFGNIDIRLTDSFNFFYKKFSDLVKFEKNLLISKLTLSKLPPLVVEMSIFLALIVIVLINIFQKRTNQELIFQISIFGISAFKLMPSFNRIMIAFINIKSNLFSAGILAETDSRITEDLSVIKFDETVILKDIIFQYTPHHKVFNNLNLTIRKGEKIGIVGESGSGKSTLLQILLGKIDIQKGLFEVDGLTITSANRTSWRRNVGFVSQDVFILDDTLEANIAFGREMIDQETLEKVIGYAALKDFVASLYEGIKTKIGEGGGLISGGQRQRIAIARALYNGANLLLLDEATSSLDAKTENMIKETINQLPANVTVISISHKRSFLDFCDAIYELRDGKLEAV